LYSFSARRVPWQRTLRALADKDSELYTKGRLGEERKPFEGTPIVISEETSELRPVQVNLTYGLLQAMSSQVAIPPLIGLDRKIKYIAQMDVFSSSASIGQHFSELDSKFPPIDTMGGTIEQVIESEEIDPVDGCRVQILEYRILMPDKMTELIKTIRRK
ncbi:hypothetical protein PFISCL1PPCAC_14412, partial [Pristionchus fissidentatus]